MSRDYDRLCDRIVTGIRLLRAVFVAQRAHDYWSATFMRSLDPEWLRTRGVLDAANVALDVFEMDTEAADWKLKQAGDTE